MRAQLFQQDFSASSTLASYISANPNSGQWNAISSSGAQVSVGIVNGALNFTRGSGNAGVAARTTDFAGPPTSLMYKFDLTLSGNSTATSSAATWLVGSTFDVNASPDANAKVHSKFSLNLTAAPGQFALRNIGAGTNSSAFTGTQAITWVINNSGGPLTYLAPDNSQETVPDDAADIWAGTTKALDNVAATTGTQILTDMKFVFASGSGSITLDNFNITTVPTGVMAPIVIFGPIVTNDLLAVRYQGSPNTSYTLEAATVLPTLSWQKLANATSDGAGQFELTTSTDGFPARFVRAVFPSY